MLTINAIIRKNKGKGASRRLRLANKFPAIVYGGGEAPLAIAIDYNIVLNTQNKEGFYTDVLALVIDGKESKVKVQAVQRHPFKEKLTHIDFIRA
ncbi:MAG: 50S ribosomal protein L25 [Sodalis sp. (in: enterobacteria)]